MTDPTPFTNKELAKVAAHYDPQRTLHHAIDRPWYRDIRRLLATVDRWREAHRQVMEQAEMVNGERNRAVLDLRRVAAERDALRAEVDAAHASMRKALDPATSINDAWRLLADHVGWHDAPVEDTAPAEPVCTTCNDEGGRYHRNSRGDIDGPWYPCPDCRPVGDLPGDAG